MDRYTTHGFNQKPYWLDRQEGSVYGRVAEG